VARVVGATQSVLISPDGKHAYSGYNVLGISVFDRSSGTGKLTQKAGTHGCITNDGTDDTGASTCAVGRALKGAYGIVLAPNGQTLYAPAEQEGALAILHVNSDGTLTQLVGTKGCISETGLDQNGAPCAHGHGMPGPYGAAVAPDGRTLYLANDEGPNGYGSVPVFSLDPTTGQATQLAGKLGCVSNDGTDAGTPGGCAVGRAVDEAWSVIVSPDGKSVYVAGLGANGVAIFSRQTAQ
jgi:DNA-binding beta-propeller fold protein YncE